MTIEKGRPWGEPGALAADGVLVRTDTEARAVVEQARRRSAPIPPLGLLGGDLCRTVGGKGDEARLRGTDAVRLPVDVGSVLVDGRQHWFVAHLIARRSWWTGRLFAAMNAQWFGRWDVAPRSHPNDGRLDVFDTSMPIAERFKARSRLPTGTHVPHPLITERRMTAIQVDFDHPTPVWLDGERVGAARHLSLRVEPDALLCVV